MTRPVASARWCSRSRARVMGGARHPCFKQMSGDMLRTRISRPPDRTVYGSGLCSHILRDQLQVSPEEFWPCVNDGIVPPRSQPAQTQHSIPTEVLYLLRERVGLRDDQLAELTTEAAFERLQQYWTTGQ